MGVRFTDQLTGMCAAIAVVMPLSMPYCAPATLAPTRVEFYRAGGYSFSWRERRAVERIAVQTADEVRRLLPALPEQLLVKVRAGSSVIPETGEASTAVGPNVVWWDVNPKHEGGVRKTIERELRASLFHAFHHLVRNNARVGRGFRDTIVSEGMAIAFERDFGRVARPWGAYSEADQARTREVLEMPDDTTWGVWLKSDRRSRRWAGQRVGTFVVDRASQASRLNAAQMVTMPTEDVIRLAGFEPAAAEPPAHTGQ